jgi:hypothetical protein
MVQHPGAPLILVIGAEALIVDALTADYQPVANLAYNADRGPVFVFPSRLHGGF